jgi:Flp pilus assembly protein TadB
LDFLVELGGFEIFFTVCVAVTVAFVVTLAVLEHRIIVLFILLLLVMLFCGVVGLSIKRRKFLFLGQLPSLQPLDIVCHTQAPVIGLILYVVVSSLLVNGRGYIPA